MLSTRDPPQNKIYTQKESKDMEKKAGEAILILDKTDLKTKAILRKKEGNYIMTKGSI